MSDKSKKANWNPLIALMARGSRSPDEFIAKVELCCQETQETQYWLDLRDDGEKREGQAGWPPRSCYYLGMQTMTLEILEKTGLPSAQARAIVQVMELELAAQQEGLATKSEMREGFHRLEIGLERLRGDMATLLGETNSRINAIEGRLIRWVFTCILGLAPVLVGAIYFASTHWHLGR